ncbi:MAG: hypothetical protein NTV81_00200 [Candidatus Komeilibacteria bacterium]|nr:hypothetical protein [Candidatus Komeilibacteria bacterium]
MEHNLAELQELAKPALQHVELINLARIETPSQAYELALSRWPRRQAKATRFLAMLRRDHGQGAFEALITPTEHARPNGTEHAQGEKMVMLDSLYPDGVRNVVFKPHAHTADRLAIWFLTTGEQPREVSFQEEVNRLNLDTEQTQVLVRRIVDAMLAQWATPKANQFSYGGIWASAMLAVRTYLADDSELYKKVLATTIMYHGGCSKDPTNLLTAVISQEELAKVKQTEEDKNRLSGMMPDKSLQMVIDHALKYFTPEELDDLWRQMLQMRVREGFITGCIVEWWEHLKIDGEYIRDRKITKEASQYCLTRDLKILLSQEYDTLSVNATASYVHLKISSEKYLQMLESVASNCHEWCESEEGQEYFEGVLMNCLARGQAAKASITLARFGRHFNFCSWQVTLCEQVKFEKSLHRLMRGAIELAVNNRNFGVASALAEYLGEEEQADDLRQKARHSKQKVALDFTFYTRADR